MTDDYFSSSLCRGSSWTSQHATSAAWWWPTWPGPRPGCTGAWHQPMRGQHCSIRPIRCEVSSEAPYFYTGVEAVTVAVSALPRGPEISGATHVLILFLNKNTFLSYFFNRCEAFLWGRGDGDGGLRHQGESSRAAGPVAGQWSRGIGCEGRHRDHRAQGGGGHGEGGHQQQDWALRDRWVLWGEYLWCIRVKHPRVFALQSSLIRSIWEMCIFTFPGGESQVEMCGHTRGYISQDKWDQFGNQRMPSSAPAARGKLRFQCEFGK